MALCPLAQGLGIVVSELRGLLRREILLLRCVEVLFHLFYDMLCLVVILDLEIRRRLDDLMGMPAERTEFPALETIHVGEGPASRAADDEVHGNQVMCAILIKIYRRVVKTFHGIPSY